MNLSTTISIFAAQRKKTVCVDFDGVLSDHSNPSEIGAPMPAARKLIAALIAAGYAVVILTARMPLDSVRKWLAQNNFPSLRVTNKKPPAVAYIDDRAVPWKGVNHKKALRRVAQLAPGWQVR